MGESLFMDNDHLFSLAPTSRHSVEEGVVSPWFTISLSTPLAVRSLKQRIR